MSPKLDPLQRSAPAAGLAAGPGRSAGHRVALTVQAGAIAVLLVTGGLVAALRSSSGGPAHRNTAAAHTAAEHSSGRPAPGSSPAASASSAPVCPPETPLPKKDHPGAIPAGQHGARAALLAWDDGGGLGLLSQVSATLRTLATAEANQDPTQITTASCALESAVAQAQAYAPLPTAAAQGPYSDALELCYRAANNFIVSIQTDDGDDTDEAVVELEAAGMDLVQVGTVLRAITHPPAAT